MALINSVFRRKFPLLLGGGLLAMHSLTAQQVLAAEQFSCQADASGGWACAPRAGSAAVAPRPVARSAAVGSTAAVDQPVVVGAGAAVALASGPDFSRLDWVPREKLSEAQLAEIGPWCSGGYVEPRRPGMNDDTPMSEAPMYLSAKATRYAQEEQVATLAGNVVLRQSSMQIEADEANLYQLENRGELVGNVRLRENGMLVVGERAQLQLDNGEARIEEAEFVLHAAHARGSADYIKRQEDAVVLLKDGSYTSCPPGSDAWHLRGNNIKLDPATGFGTATNVTLRVKDVPVFYTPYLYFPIDDRRQSGFLAPSMSSSSNNGFSLVTPYYFNLAPNYDATLYPRFMSDRGLLMQGDFRYLTQSSQGMLSGAYLDDQNDDNEDQPKYQSDRYLMSWQHTQGLDQRLLGQVDYTDISDPYYFQDLGTDLEVSSQTFVNQQGELIWRGDSYTARLNAQAYELATVNDVSPYERLPQITLDGLLPFQPGGLQLGYATEYVSFQRDLDEYTFNGVDSPDLNLNGLNRADGDRAHVQPGISLPMSSSWGYLTPGMKYLYTDYSLDLDQQGRNDLTGSLAESTTAIRIARWPSTVWTVACTSIVIPACSAATCVRPSSHGCTIYMCLMKIRKICRSLIRPKRCSAMTHYGARTVLSAGIG
jgi:LPS-assembly protein